MMIPTDNNIGQTGLRQSPQDLIMRQLARHCRQSRDKKRQKPWKTTPGLLVRGAQARPKADKA
jgi:hypothetical protein